MENNLMAMHQETVLRIDIYNMLAHLFRQAPDQNVLSFLEDILVDASHDNNESAMTAAWSLIKLASQKTSVFAVEEEYQDVFIGIGRGEVIPFASWYLTGSLMEMPLAHLRQDLKQLGFERQETVKEPEDHIAALLEVMAMLVAEQDQATQKAFFNRHLAAWCEAFCCDVKSANSAVFYTAVAELALQFLRVEKNRLQA